MTIISHSERQPSTSCMCNMLSKTHHFLFCDDYSQPITTIHWDPICRFNSTTFVCLLQARTWISNVNIVRMDMGTNEYEYVMVFFMFNELR